MKRRPAGRSFSGDSWGIEMNIAKIGNVISMTVDEWCEVRDNPIQRDTERHAVLARRKHLAQLSPTHSIVHAALLPNNELVKLDGHSRALLWEQGLLERPSSVTVVLYPVDDDSGAERLYKQFDSPDATENSGDRLAGAYRKAGLSPESGLLKLGGVTTALSLLGGEKVTMREGVYGAVEEWSTELAWLDNLGARGPEMPSPFLAAALAILRVRGVSSLEFWGKFIRREGTTIDGEMDGVAALRQILEKHSAARTLSDKSLRSVLAGQAIGCYEAWRRGHTLLRAPAATDLAYYLKERGGAHTKRRTFTRNGKRIVAVGAAPGGF